MVENVEFVESLVQAVRSELGITGHPYATVIFTVLLGAEEDVGVAERVIDKEVRLHNLSAQKRAKERELDERKSKIRAKRVARREKRERCKAKEAKRNEG